MKTMTTEQILDLIYYFGDSVYARTDQITELAKELIEEGDELEEVEASILEEIDTYLKGFYYADFEDQGSYKRHIWHAGCDY